MLKKCFRWFFTLLILAVYIGGAVILISDTDPKQAKVCVWTESTLSQYRENPDAFTVWKFDITPNYTVTGNFYCSEPLYLESAHQLVLTVRFNRSTLKYCAEDFALPSQPDWNCFAYRLAYADGTASDVVAYTHFDKGRHEYVRLVFDGVTLSRDNTVTLQAFYTGESRNPERSTDEPYGEIRLFCENTKLTEYRLKSRDILDDTLNETPDLIREIPIVPIQQEENYAS